MTEASEATRVVVDELYDAFVRGDGEHMLSLLSDEVDVRFLGLARLRGVEELTRLFGFLAGMLREVRFTIERKVVDGQWAAVVWSEQATTAAGEPWANHGVDVIHVEAGRITVLHENSDTRLVARHFPPFG